MSRHATLTGERLVYACAHIRVILHAQVVIDVAVFPQRGNGLYSLELVGLLARVPEDGELIASFVSLAHELVKEDLLEEVGLYVVGANGVGRYNLLVEVIEPTDHFGHGTLADESREAMQIRPCLAPQLYGLVVVAGGGLERGVAIAHEIVVLGETERSAPTYPVVAEDAALRDGVVHLLALERDISHEPFLGAYLLDSPLCRPRRFAVFVDGIDLRDHHAVGSHEVGENRVFADKVADHAETATATVERAEQGFFYPLCEPRHAVGVVYKFVVVEVIYHDIVRAVLLVTKTTRRLAATASEESATVGGYELSCLPRPCNFLHPEVGYIALVELELRLYVAEERLCIVLALADKHHEVQFFEGFEIHGNADIEMDGLRVASRPLRGILDCRMVAERVRRLYLKRCAVGMLPGLLVVAVVREVVGEETAIVREEIRDAFLLLRRGLPDRHDGSRLHGLAPLLPLFNRFLAGLCGVPCHITLPCCRAVRGYTCSDTCSPSCGTRR